MISFILIDTFYALGILLLIILFDNPNNSLFHFFLHYMIFARCIYLIQELFFTFFKVLLSFFIAFLSVSLLFHEIILEKSEVFFRKRFNCQIYLLLKIISWVFRKWPPNKLLDWDYILR
jgi:hypothetical protein